MNGPIRQKLGDIPANVKKETNMNEKETNINTK